MDNLGIWILVLATPFAIVYVLILSKWRFSKRVTVIATALCIVGITVMNFKSINDMAWMVAENPFLDLACRMLNISLETALAFILTKQSKAQTVFIVLSTCLCVIMVDAVAISMDVYIGSELSTLIFKLLLYIFVTVVLYRLRKTFWEVALYMKNRLWFICAVQTVLYIFSLMLVSFPVPLNLAPENIPFALMMCLVSISVYGIFLYIFRLIHKQSIMEKNTMAFHIYAASLEQQNEFINKNAEKAALFRHDIRHVSQMISVCAENGDINGIKELIKLLDNNVSTNGGLVINPITGNKLLDTVLNTYISYADESGIDISLNITGIESVSADMAELAVVLANALENAVNACKKQNPEEKRAIRMDGRKKGRQYFLEIANTFSGEVNFDADTGLPAGKEEGHGTGVKSIAYFAEKSHAELQYQTEGNWFHMRMLIR